MKTPLVTILIDTYNYGKYIREALESVLAQDFPEHDREIVVVDDGSTDDTSERVKAYGSQVKYLIKKNGGQGSAINAGFAEARGEIIAFLDADDYWLPGKLERIVGEFRKDLAVGMVHHRLRELNERTGQFCEGMFTPENGNLAANCERILQYNPSPTSSIAFRRGVLEKILPMPESIRISADSYLQALAPFLGSIAAIDESLGVYRNHGANAYFLSSSEGDKERHRRRAIAMRAIVSGMREWFSGHGFCEADLVVRTITRRWMTMQEQEEFEAKTPGRARFFLHLVHANWYRGPQRGWKLKATNAADAMAGLVVGYEGYSRWIKTREKLKEWLSGRRKKRTQE